tara:strand:- start:979 stop:1194 length:216 start_codon:yes stop_codon:yes gene_type:complete
MRRAANRPTVGWITSDKIKLYFAGKNVKDASIWIRQEKDKDLNDEINRLRDILSILEDRHDIDMSQFDEEE